MVLCPLEDVSTHLNCLSNHYLSPHFLQNIKGVFVVVVFSLSCHNSTELCTTNTLVCISASPFAVCQGPLLWTIFRHCRKNWDGGGGGQGREMSCFYPESSVSWKQCIVQVKGGFLNTQNHQSFKAGKKILEIFKSCLGDTQNSFGHGTGQAALGGPALAGRLDQMISTSPLQQETCPLLYYMLLEMSCWDCWGNYIQTLTSMASQS